MMKQAEKNRKCMHDRVRGEASLGMMGGGINRKFENEGIGGDGNFSSLGIMEKLLSINGSPYIRHHSLVGMVHHLLAALPT